MKHDGIRLERAAEVEEDEEDEDVGDVGGGSGCCCGSGDWDWDWDWDWDVGKIVGWMVDETSDAAAAAADAGGVICGGDIAEPVGG